MVTPLADRSGFGSFPLLVQFIFGVYIYVIEIGLTSRIFIAGSLTAPNNNNKSTTIVTQKIIIIKTSVH